MVAQETWVPTDWNYEVSDVFLAERMIDPPQYTPAGR